MNKINYQQKLDEIIDMLHNENKVPKLLLHVCCAPCNSYVLEYLSSYFDITVFFYNPNISPEEEYCKRVEEEKRFLAEFPKANNVTFVEGIYEPELFYEMAHGKEDLPEGGKRCYGCYELRLDAAARYAAEHGFDYYTTSLSISPHKNAEWLNEIGNRLGEKHKIAYLPSDFKKKNGYRRSIELSKEYNLYRQNYCGCEFSKRAAEIREQNIDKKIQ